MTSQLFGYRTGRSRSEERVKHHVADIGRSHNHAIQQRFRLLGRMQLIAVFAFQAFLAGAKRNLPVAAHLRIVIQRFHRFIVKRIF